MAWCREEPTTQITSASPSSGQPRRPLGESPPRSRAGRSTAKSPPRSRAGRPLGRISASLEGWTPPRANLRLARGLDAPSGESPPRSGAGRPSGESPPCSRPLRARSPHAHSPDQSIKFSDTTRAPGSKANPCHAGPLTPLGNHIPVLFRQPSS
jgi:hypothetical protein